MSTGVIHFVDHVRVPSDVFTLDGFREWAHSATFPESGRICFIRGNLEIDMSPEALFHHDAVKPDLYVDFGTLVRRMKLRRTFVDGAFLVNTEAGLATDPDFLYCSYRSIRGGKVRFVAKSKRTERLVEIRGTPDLVCEIVSTNSARKAIALRRAYFEAGIPEYWLIDPRGRSVKFQILSPGNANTFQSMPTPIAFDRPFWEFPSVSCARSMKIIAPAIESFKCERPSTGVLPFANTIPQRVWTVVRTPSFHSLKLQSSRSGLR